jgi:N-methylhydantoinase A
MRLDQERARARMQDLARQLSLPLEAAAWGVIRVANSNMERAIRTISIERGHDPRDFALVAFGGAGPLHACELAAALRIPRVLIPPSPGVLSALGMVLSDVVKDTSQTVMLPASELDGATLWRLFDGLFDRARAGLRAEGFEDDDIALTPSVDMRYKGQSYELRILARLDQETDELARSFHLEHRQRFSYANQDEPVEIVNLRVKAVSRPPEFEFSYQEPGGLDPREAQVGYKPAYFADREPPHPARPFPAALYERDRLEPGNMVVGPAILFQLDTTTVIPPDWAATVDGWGNLVAEQQ